jgi:hypothetical protein
VTASRSCTNEVGEIIIDLQLAREVYKFLRTSRESNPDVIDWIAQEIGIDALIEYIAECEANIVEEGNPQ